MKDVMAATTALERGLPCGDGSARRLRTIEENVSELFAQAIIADVRYRYAIGRLVLSASQSGGARLESMGGRLGCSSKLLYQYAQVPKRFVERELDRWLACRGSHGQPPAWSHFVVLSSVDSPARRAALMSSWLARPTGVRELAAAARGVHAKCAESEGVALEREVHSKK